MPNPSPNSPPGGPPAFADVVVPRQIDRAFTYKIPTHLRNHLQVGSRVQVPFGPSILQGVIVSLSRDPSGSRELMKMARRPLRDILSILESQQEPALDDELLDLAHFISSRYVAPLGTCIQLVAPPVSTPGLTVSYTITDVGRQVYQGTRRLSPTAREVLSRLAGNPKGLTLSTLRRTVKGSLDNTLARMKKQHWVEERERKKVFPSNSRPQESPVESRERVSSDSDHGETLFSGLGLWAPLPASWQIRLKTALDSSTFGAFLLNAPVAHRLAGMLEATEETLGHHRTALLVLGELSRALELHRRARERWGDRVQLLHSGLSSKVRAEAWHRIRNGTAKIVVGTRSAIFAPLRSLGFVCLDTEEEASFKEEQEPRYHAREVALFRARRNLAVLLIGSSYPTVETMNVIKTVGECFHVHEDPGGRPHIQVVDRREIPYGTFLSPSMLEGIETAVHARDLVVLYHNRRGFAPVLFCRDCGTAPVCSNCSVALTVYRQTVRLTCRYCGTMLPLPDTCPTCRGTRLEPQGYGTERLEEEMRRLFPRARIVRFDRDLFVGRHRIEQIRREIWAGRVNILIGTQMLFRSGPLPQAGFVGIPNADAGLHRPDFRAAERTFHGLERAVRLVRSDQAGGRVVLQTYLPDHYVFSAVVSGEVENFFEQELSPRRALAYPPFSTLINLRVSGRQLARVREAAQHWADLVKECADSDPQAWESILCKGRGENRSSLGHNKPGIHILGPIPAYVAQIRGRYRWQCSVKSEDGEVARRAVKASLSRLEAEQGRGSLRFDVDVDPIEIP